jgi:peptide/nickel transport system substrate-binding protein
MLHFIQNDRQRFLFSSARQGVLTRYASRSNYMVNLTNRLLSTVFRACMAAIIVIPSLLMSVATTHAQTPTRTINGFEVSDRFLEVWSRQGSERESVYVNGLPITARRSEISMDNGKLYDTQWFERARYELHPENKPPADVLLGRLGASRVEGRGKIDLATGHVATPADAPFVGVNQPDGLGASKLWFPETRHTLSGKLLDYWKRYGGISQFGLPLSEPFTETSHVDGKSYTVQYFERNRMELHPEKPAPYDVELGLLGVEQYAARAVPGDELPVAPPKDVKSTKEEIRIGMGREPEGLSLFDGTSAAGRVRSLIEDQLVGRDDNDNLFPLNAWYVPTLENGGATFVGEGEDRHLRVKYKIRQGIKWSDGVELTSNDAIFAYRLIMNPDAPVVSRSEFQRLQNVDNPDKYTVIYSYRSTRQAAAFLNGLTPGDKKNYSFLQIFADQKKPVISRAYSEVGAIYPEHVLGKIPPGKIFDDPVSRAPVGTGPYMVTKWTTGQEIVLVPNENYSLTAKPSVKKIVLKFIYGDSLLGQVQTGDIDLLTSDMFVVPPANAADLKAKGLIVATRPAATWEHIDFHLDYGPFKEKAVREAIFRAINRQGIVDKVYRGGGAVLNGVVPPGVYFSLENPDFARNYPGIATKYKLPVYSYDPEYALRLLNDAGWVPGPDGIRAKGGMKLSFVYATTINAIRQQIQSLVVADLKAIGVDAQQKAYPASYLDYFDTTEFYQSAWLTTRGSDFAVWTCPELFDPSKRSGTNHQRYCSPQLDAANAKFNSEIDLQAQVTAAAEAQVILMQDIVTIPLVQRPNVEVVTSKLANYKITNSATSSFWNARQWYFR